jgi:hypothetical protein
MPALAIVDLTCYVTEDPLTDEVILQVNGSTVFGPTPMSKDDVVAVSEAPRFTGTATVTLLDDESSSDDFLGSVAIPESSPLVHQQFAIFHATSAVYSMRYMIMP